MVYLLDTGWICEGGHTPLLPQDILPPKSGGTLFVLVGGCLWVLLFDAVGVRRETPKLPSPGGPPNTTETKDGGHKVTPTTSPHFGVGSSHRATPKSWGSPQTQLPSQISVTSSLAGL